MFSAMDRFGTQMALDLELDYANYVPQVTSPLVWTVSCTNACHGRQLICTPTDRCDM